MDVLHRRRLVVAILCASAAIAAVLVWAIFGQQGAGEAVRAEADEGQLGIEDVFVFRHPPSPEAKLVGFGWVFELCRAAITSVGIDERSSAREAVIAEDRDEADRTIVKNPLEDLGQDELLRLESVSIKAWSDSVARSLHKLDLRRTCVAVAPQWLQKIPEDTAMLLVSLPDNDGPVMDLSRFTDLRYLRIEAWYSDGKQKPRTVVNMASLNAPRLEYLHIAGEIRNAQAISRLRSLRQLDLSDATGIDSLEFARELAEIESLSIRKVTDLRPIGGLSRLAVVNAYASDVSDLPMASMPALRLLDVLSSPVGEDQVKSLARLNPRCRIRHRYRAELQEAIAGATEVRVVKDDETVRIVSTPREVASLLAFLQIEEPELRVSRQGGHIRCVPRIVFEVVTPKAVRRVAPVGPGYLRLIRQGEDDPTASQWPADVPLKPDSRAALDRWLETQGLGSCCGE